MTTTIPTLAPADLDLDKLEALARAATPQNFDSAQVLNQGHIECPSCDGSGEVELTADYCNYDGRALGVQFYGIGPEHRAAEAFYRAANPAAVLQLIALARRAAQPVAPVQQNGKREGFEAAAKALQERAAGHKHDGEYERYEECMECVSMLHDLKPAATPSPQIAEVAELPPLPVAAARRLIPGRKGDPELLYTAEQYRQGQRDAIAASRRSPAPASAGQAKSGIPKRAWSKEAEMMESWAEVSAGQAAPAHVRSYREEEFLTAARVALVALAHAAEKHGIYQTDHDRFAAAVEKFAAQPAEGAAAPADALDAARYREACGEGGRIHIDWSASKEEIDAQLDASIASPK